MNIKLARTQHGTMIHRAACGQINKRQYGRADCLRNYKGRAVPWDWADTATENLIAWYIVHLGYRTCKQCKPVSDKEIDGWRKVQAGDYS